MLLKLNRNRKDLKIVLVQFQENLFNLCTCYIRTYTAKLIGALFAADASKVAHNNNNNNNNNNKGSDNNDLVSTLFWDSVLREFRKDRRSHLHGGGSVKSAMTLQLNLVYIVPLVLSATGIVPNKLHGSLKLLIVRPGLYVVMQKGAVLSTWRIVRDF